MCVELWRTQGHMLHLHRVQHQGQHLLSNFSPQCCNLSEGMILTGLNFISILHNTFKQLLAEILQYQMAVSIPASCCRAPATTESHLVWRFLLLLWCFPFSTAKDTKFWLLNDNSYPHLLQSAVMWSFDLYAKPSEALLPILQIWKWSRTY